MSLESRLRRLEAEAETDEELPQGWGMSALLRLRQRYQAQACESVDDDEGEPTGLQRLLRDARKGQAEQR